MRISYLLLRLIKWLQAIFFPITLSSCPKTQNREVTFCRKRPLAIILNHSSFIEIMLAGLVSNQSLKYLSEALLLPVAAHTHQRPIGRYIINHLGPHVVALSAKRDQAWQQFLHHLEGAPPLIFFPEGRMARLDGLDKDGQPMHLKRGIFDVLQRYRGKEMYLLCLGGFGHVLPRGKWLPKLFKTSVAKLEVVEVDELMHRFTHADALCQYLEAKRDTYLEAIKLRQEG